MRKKKSKFKGFNLLENTTGVILSGIYLKEDNSEIIVDMAWGGRLHFKPLTEYEKTKEADNKKTKI